jgi:hypothetical protein
MASIFSCQALFFFMLRAFEPATQIIENVLSKIEALSMLS